MLLLTIDLLLPADAQGSVFASLVKFLKEGENSLFIFPVIRATARQLSVGSS